MPVAATARRLRAVLALTTACGALFPTLALAQSGQVRLPTESDVRDVRTDGLRPDFRDSSDKLRVDLRGRNTVINWDGFNIPEGKEIDFTDGRLAGSLRGDIAVLNRDVSSKPSQLLGKLSSDPNVAVWVHNANGILVGSKAAFNTGSLVLTTLDISPEDFVRAGDSYRLQSSAGSQAAITVEQGAKLRVDGSTRGLVMLAPKIDAHGEFVAEGQDVAFVTASDVTLDYRSGSPLSVTLNRGSAVAGTSQYVRGSVAGNNAIFALASQDTLTDSLLQVSAAVTTASAGSRGIVLSAGKPATAVSGVTVAGDAAATGGVARLLVDGALRTDNRDADVIAGASGALSLTGAVQTRDNLIAGSGALLEVTNNVTAGGDVLLSGRGVTLGGTDPVTQRAGGQFRVSSTDGDITGIGAVTLRSGDTGDSGLLLETLGSTGGNIALGSASRLIAGDDRRGGLTLSRRDTANSIDIGTVDARALRGAVGSGAVRTGNVNVREALSIGGASVTTGNLASERAVDVRGSGAVTTGGIASGAGTAVVAGGALTVGGDVLASDDVSLRGSGVALDGATLRSGGGIDVTALNGGITGSRALAIVSSSGQRSDVVKLQAAGVQGIVLADGSSITGGTNRALDVRIFAASDAPLKLGDVTARSLGTIATLDGATANGGAFRSTGSLTFGRLDLVDGFTAESTGGSLTVGRIAVSGALQGIDLRAAGTLSVQNDISTSGAVTLSSGAALTLGAIESRDRAVTLTSGGALRADRLTAAAGATANGTSITLGDVRGGTGAVLLTASTGDLSLGSAAGRRVALEAAGGVGVTGGLTADAGAIDVSGGRAISVAGAIRSTGGGVRIVSSGGPVGVTGGLTSDAAATLSGTALTLGGTHSARGAYSASASSGGIARNGTGLSIRSDSDASGAEGVTLSAAGGAIDLSDARINAGGTARLSTDGQGITVGAVEAGGLVATGATATGVAIRTGELRVQGPVTLSAVGDVTTGAITTNGAVTLTGNAVGFGNARASSLTATASGGAVNGGDLTVAGPVTLRAAGDVSTGTIGSDGAVALTGNALRFGNIRAASLSATAANGASVGGTVDTSGAVTVQATAGALTLGRVVTTQGDVVLSALGPVFVQGVNAGGTASIVGTGTGNDVSIVDGVASNGAVTVRSGRDIRTPFIRSATGALTVAAPNGRLAGFVGGTGTSLSAGAGQPFSLTVGTDAVLGDVVGGNISITATAITANRIDGGALPVALNATVGDLTVIGPVTGSTVSLTAAGRALLGSVDASGAVTLGGAQGLSFDRVSGASISATGGAIRGNALSSTGRIVLQGGDVTLDRIDVDTLEAAASGALAINTLQATGNATLSGAAGSFGSLTAGGSLGITTTGALRFDRLAAQNVAATAQSGTLAGATVVTTGNATLAGQSIDVASVETGASLSATSVDTMAIGSVRATGDATLVAGTNGTFGTVTTGGALDATSNGALRFDRLAGRTIAATATNGALTGTAMVATGDVALAGGSIEVGTVESGGTLSARSVGSATIGAVQASGDATLIAGTTGSYGTVTAGGALSATAAGSLRFDRLTGRSVAASSQGGTLTGTAIVARGDAALGGQSIDVGSVESAGSLLADATAGGLRFGTIATGGNATLRATGAATLGGAVTTGGAYRVTAGSIALDGTQRAGGEVRMVATGGAITGGSGLTLASGTATGATTGGTPIVLDAAAGIDLSGATLRASNGSALALRAGPGQAIRLGSVEAGSLGGFDGSAPTDRLTHDGSLTTGDLTLGRLAVTLTAGDLATGRIAASGPVSLIANTGSIRGGDLTAGTLEARAGSTLALGLATVGGSATLEAGTIDLRALTAQALTIKTAGTVGGANGGTTALRTTGGDLTVDAGTARLGSVDSAGSATLRGGAIEVRERLSAARALLVEARSALTLQNAAAGSDLSLASTGAVSAGELSAGGALSVDGAGVAIGAARAGGAFKATSSAGLSLGSGNGDGIVLDAVGLVRAGALTGGPSVSIRGADAELSGAIQGSSVRFATRDPATTALRIGDGTQGGGFRLSAAEVGQVAADTLAFDSGSGAMEIGTVALAPGVGRSVEMLSTGDVRVTGQVSASGAGRSIRIGGDGTSGNAATIHLIATSDAGGRLLLGDNDLDLRGNRIAAGLAPGFLDTLAPGDAGRAQAQALIGNPNSSLYNSQLGGGFFAPDATTLVAARSMSVRFGDYALFQNTGVPGRSSGVTVGSLAAPITPALRIATFGTPSAASFAFFGEINGVTGAGAALLGNPVIDIQPALLPNSRINGCLAGSGAGCLTTIVIQPTLQVFDWDSQAVFGILQDVSLPFTPIIGGNNEALLSGLPALAPETPADAAAPAPTVAVPPQQEPKS